MLASLNRVFRRGFSGNSIAKKMSILSARGVEIPDSNARAWRYLSFSKFVAMLSAGALYFARLDKLGDDLEGTLPDAVARQYGSSMNDWFSANKNRLFANCWHLSTVESALMWKAYSIGEPAVAIESSYEKIVASLSGLPDAYIVGTMSYLDYSTDKFAQYRSDDVNVVAQAFHKRKYFEAESELRIVINPFSDIALQAQKDCRIGVNIRVDLNGLIERIWVVADPLPWLFDTVSSVAVRYGINKEVRSSGV